MMSEDDITQSTVRLPTEKMEWLRSELSHFSTDAARFQFLVQFYSDYKEVGHPQPVNYMICEKDTVVKQNDDPDDR